MLRKVVNNNLKMSVWRIHLAMSLYYSNRTQRVRLICLVTYHWRKFCITKDSYLKHLIGLPPHFATEIVKRCTDKELETSDWMSPKWRMSLDSTIVIPTWSWVSICWSSRYSLLPTKKQRRLVVGDRKSEGSNDSWPAFMHYWFHERFIHGMWSRVQIHHWCKGTIHRIIFVCRKQLKYKKRFSSKSQTGLKILKICIV